MRLAKVKSWALVKVITRVINQRINPFLNWMGYLAMFGITWITAKILFKIEVTGREHILDQENFIVISRHRSSWDIPLVGHGLGPGYFPKFVARRGLDWIKNFPFLKYYCLLINREKPQLKEIRRIAKTLTSRPIIIFPEATRHSTEKYKPGFIWLSQLTQRPIVPINIKVVKGNFGEQESWRDYLLGQVKIELRIGKPLLIDPRINKKHFQKMAQRIFDQIVDKL